MEIFTIGFTKTSAREFFGKLTRARIERLVDVRLNNSSQLAGFTKKEDLEFFLRAIAGIGYVHLADLAPTQDILTAYKKEKGDWAVYQAKFLALMRARRSGKLNAESNPASRYGCRSGADSLNTSATRNSGRWARTAGTQ